MKISPRARCVSSCAIRASVSSSRSGTPANTGFPPRKAAISLADIVGRIAWGPCREIAPGAEPLPHRPGSDAPLSGRIHEGLYWHRACSGNLPRRTSDARTRGAVPDRADGRNTGVAGAAPLIDAPTVLQRSPAAIQGTLGRPVRIKGVPSGDVYLPDG